MLCQRKNEYEGFINYRRPLQHTYECLTREKKLTVVYFGGSITHGYGSTEIDKYSWRALSVKWFRDNFPEAEINDVRSAIGESGSYLGVYRLERDVLSQSPDLVFIEFAINDLCRGATLEQAQMQYETIVREIKRAFPLCDIVTLFAEARKTASEKQLFAQAMAHERISYVYNIPTLLVGKALVNSFKGSVDDNWDRYFIDTVHPSDAGYFEYYKCVREFLHNSLLATDLSQAKPGFSPLTHVCSNRLLDGERNFLCCGRELLDNARGFSYSEEVYINLPKTPYVGYLYTSSRDAELTYSFFGTEFGIYSNFYKGEKIECSVDGGAYITVCCSEHNPTLAVSGLEAGEHTVRIKPAFSEHSPKPFKLPAIFTRNAEQASRIYSAGPVSMPKSKGEFFTQQSLPVAVDSLSRDSEKRQLLCNGAMVWRVVIESKKGGEDFDIMHIADTHLNHINEDDFLQNHPSVVSTLEFRRGFKGHETFENLSTVMSYAPLFDRLVVNGDIMDYLTCGALEMAEKYIYKKCPEALATVGGHDITRKMQGRIEDESSLESRYAILGSVFRNDLFYHSETIANRALLVLLNNGESRYYGFQVEKLRADIDRARREGLVILIFQHEPFCTKNGDEVMKTPLWKSSNGLPLDFCNGGLGCKDSDEITRLMHKTVCDNADVIRGVFCGHEHNDYHTEIIGSYLEGGVRREAVIPQYITAGVPYQKGHIMIVTLR